MNETWIAHTDKIITNLEKTGRKLITKFKKNL